MVEVVDMGVISWIEQRFVAVVVPTDEIRRTTIWSTDFEYFAVPDGLPYVVSADDDPISRTGVHDSLSFIGVIHVSHL